MSVILVINPLAPEVEPLGRVTLIAHWVWGRVLTSMFADCFCLKVNGSDERRVTSKDGAGRGVRDGFAIKGSPEFVEGEVFFAWPEIIEGAGVALEEDGILVG